MHRHKAHDWEQIKGVERKEGQGQLRVLYLTRRLASIAGVPVVVFWDLRETNWKPRLDQKRRMRKDCNLVRAR